MTVLKWQVHCCPGASGHFIAQPHFHLLNNPEIPSWPFWSLEIGLMLADFCITDLISPDDPELPLERVQAEIVRAELIRLAETQRRSATGQFLKGFKLPRARSRFDQGAVATSWGAFFRAEAAYVSVYEDLLQREIPLVGCDFINRPNERELAARGLMVLEQAIATPRSLVEAGIALGLV